MYRPTRSVRLSLVLILVPLILFGAAFPARAQSCVAPPADILAWWPGDGHARDVIGTHHGTPTNGPIYVDGRVGRAFRFDGVDDYVDVGAIDLAGRSFSLEVWVKRGSVGTPDAIFGHGSYAYLSGLHVGFRADNSFVFGFHTDDLNVPGPFTDTGWHHWVATFDLATTRRTLYLDGEQVGQDSGVVYAGTGSLYIGKIPWANHEWVNGGPMHADIDEPTVYGRELSAAEVAALYAAGNAGKCLPCLPAPSGLVSWWPANGTAIDVAGANDAAPQGDATYAAGKVGQAFSVDGDGDYFSVPVPTGLPLGAAPRSVTFWMKTPTDLTSATESGMFLYGTPAVAQMFGLITSANSRGALYFYGYAVDVAGGSILPNTWYHAGATYDGTTARIYLNGQYLNQITYPLNTVLNADGISIGSRRPDTYWNGQIDEVMLFDRALSGDEVAALHGAGGAGACAIWDTTPDAFSFEDETGVERSVDVVSNEITVAGIDTPTPISIVGGRYSIDGGEPTDADGLVENGQVVTVAVVSSPDYSTTVDAVLTIGGVEDTFSVTTKDQPQYNLTAQADGNGAGSVSSAVGKIAFDYPALSSATTTLVEGTAVDVVATAAAGSTVAWSGGCSSVASPVPTTDVTESTCTIDSLGEDTTVTATFTLTRHQLSVTKSGTGTGAVTADEGTLVWVGNVGTATYDYGTEVTLTAEPGADSVVDGWTGCATADGNTCHVSMTGARNVTVTFRLVTAVRVLAPNGGETLHAGAVVLLQWEAPAAVTKFQLKYSLNGGAGWKAVVPGKVTGTSFAWTVPLLKANAPACLVQVTGFNAANRKVGVDVSDAPFAIDVLTVTSPNGGETLTSGVPYAVTWVTRGTLRPVASAQVMYSTNGGRTWKNGASVPGNPGTLNWTPPAFTADQPTCKVKVILRDAGKVMLASDVSDAVFTIAGDM